MKKVTILLLSLIFLGTSISYAGFFGKKHCAKSGEAYSEKYIQKKVKKVTKKFDLSDDQKVSFEGILRKKMEKKSEAKTKYYDEKKTIHESFVSDMHGILNDEQKEKFDSYMAKKYKKKKHCTK